MLARRCTGCPQFPRPRCERGARCDRRDTRFGARLRPISRDLAMPSISSLCVACVLHTVPSDLRADFQALHCLARAQATPAHLFTLRRCPRRARHGQRKVQRSQARIRAEEQRDRGGGGGCVPRQSTYAAPAVPSIATRRLVHMLDSMFCLNSWTFLRFQCVLRLRGLGAGVAPCHGICIFERQAGAIYACRAASGQQGNAGMMPPSDSSSDEETEKPKDGAKQSLNMFAGVRPLTMMRAGSLAMWI